MQTGGRKAKGHTGLGGRSKVRNDFIYFNKYLSKDII